MGEPVQREHAGAFPGRAGDAPLAMPSPGEAVALDEARGLEPGRPPLASGLRPAPLGGRPAADLDDPAAPPSDPAGSEAPARLSGPAPSTLRRQPRRPLGRTPTPPLAITSPVAIGSLLDGRYRLREVLAEGGMGTLVLAHNEALDLAVVVKLLRPDTPAEWGVSLGHRLVQEARAAARLGHPAIVRVLDFGVTEQGCPYLVMERLEGEDLGRELSRRGRIPPQKAVRCLLPIAHGLAAAHAKGIVHRDIKPENVFLARTDAGRIQPKLIDFGVAKLEPDPASQRLPTAGGPVGSPGYMAPEQARGEDVGPAADVWSLSVVLYEMVTGSLPFEAASYQALVRAILEHEPRPISALLPAEEELSAIVARGLAKEPRDRWPSMQRLGTELAAWLLRRGIREDVCGTALETAWRDESFDGGDYDAFASVRPRAFRAESGVRPRLTSSVERIDRPQSERPLAPEPCVTTRRAIPPPPFHSGRDGARPGDVGVVLPAIPRLAPLGRDLREGSGAVAELPPTLRSPPSGGATAARVVEADGIAGPRAAEPFERAAEPRGLGARWLGWRPWLVVALVLLGLALVGWAASREWQAAPARLGSPSSAAR